MCRHIIFALLLNIRQNHEICNKSLSEAGISDILFNFASYN